MKDTKTEEERAAFLTTLGLNPKAKTLAALPTEASAKTTGKISADIKLAPTGIDPRSMPVDEIEFDPRLLDDFASLEGDGLAAASAHVFALYKSYGRNKDRNGALHRKITAFITHTRRSRETGGMVKEKVKTTKADRDLAALLASQGVTQTDLAEALALLAKQREAK